MKDRIDRCDALDLLEAAVVTRKVATVVADDGEQFTGRVTDVVTEGGDDHAVFEDGRRIGVRRIVRVEVAELA